MVILARNSHPPEIPHTGASLPRYLYWVLACILGLGGGIAGILKNILVPKVQKCDILEKIGLFLFGVENERIFRSFSKKKGRKKKGLHGGKTGS